MSQIPLASPDIRQSDVDLVKNVLMSGMLVQGKFVAQLENEISKISQSNNSIALSNGTATMHLALVSLGIGKGDEVIVPVEVEKHDPSFDGFVNKPVGVLNARA